MACVLSAAEIAQMAAGLLAALLVAVLFAEVAFRRRGERVRRQTRRMRRPDHCSRL